MLRLIFDRCDIVFRIPEAVCLYLDVELLSYLFGLKTAEVYHCGKLVDLVVGDVDEFADQLSECLGDDRQWFLFEPDDIVIVPDCFVYPVI